MGPTGEGLWKGIKGDSAFTNPFLNHRFEPNRLPEFMQRIEKTGDDRSFVIVSAVVVERYLDALLEAIAPTYRHLSEKREFTFSLKLDLLSSLKLIPPHIVRVADCLRKIRNEFAHDLDCDQLERLDPRLKSALAQNVRELYDKQASSYPSAREMFKALTFLAIVGYEDYRPNLAILREKIDDQVFSDQLQKESQKRLMAKIESMQSKAPTRVEEKQGFRYEYYEGGVVNISPVDPEHPATTLNLDPSDLV
jgi:hypothetical protein